MTERERLIELLGQAKALEASGIDCKVTDENIADYLLANGVVVPPYKIGDKLWGFDEEGFATEYEIQRIDIQLVIETTYYMFYGVGEYGELISFDNSDIGENVFPTKEEAEQALEALSK